MLSHCFNVQSDTLTHPFWTSCMPPATLTSNLADCDFPFGLPHAFPPLQRPIWQTVASLLDSHMLSHFFNVQSDRLWLLFWTSYVPHTTLASNLPCSGFLFGLFLASHSSNVQSDSLRLSFWTFSVPHTTLTSNPPRVDFSFGLLLASRSSNVQPDVSPTQGRTSIRHERTPKGTTTIK